MTYGISVGFDQDALAQVGMMSNDAFKVAMERQKAEARKLGRRAMLPMNTSG